MKEVPTYSRVKEDDELPDFEGRLRLLLVDADLEKLEHTEQVFTAAIAMCKQIYCNTCSIQVSLTCGLIELGRQYERSNWQKRFPQETVTSIMTNLKLRVDELERKIIPEDQEAPMEKE